jgi:hypothetical protein
VLWIHALNKAYSTLCSHQALRISLGGRTVVHKVINGLCTLNLMYIELFTRKGCCRSSSMSLCGVGAARIRRCGIQCGDSTSQSSCARS